MNKDDKIARLEAAVLDLQAWVLVLQYLLANLLRSGPDTRALRTLFEVTTSENMIDHA